MGKLSLELSLPNMHIHFALTLSISKFFLISVVWEKSISSLIIDYITELQKIMCFKYEKLCVLSLSFILICLLHLSIHSYYNIGVWLLANVCKSELVIDYKLKDFL